LSPRAERNETGRVLLESHQPTQAGFEPAVLMVLDDWMVLKSSSGNPVEARLAYGVWLL
jgi:hypothetical protein